MVLTVSADPGEECRVGGLNAFPPDEWNHALTGLLVSNAVSFAEHYGSAVSVTVDDEWIVTARFQGLCMRKMLRTPANVGPTELEEAVEKIFAFLSIAVQEKRLEMADQR
ncbi:hypothetical protein DVR11_02900 [Paracoccus versutus]|nr:hypothetical protein DVR11_02900 [Paracoccus versutus]